MAKDPNKYSKNADIKPESKLSVLLAILRLVLMLIGIFGVAFELFREDGWLSKLLGDIFNSTTNMILAALVLSGLWLLNRWISNPQKTQSRGIGDIPMYAMMAVGAYYLYHLYSSGRLMF